MRAGPRCAEKRSVRAQGGPAAAPRPRSGPLCRRAARGAERRAHVRAVVDPGLAAQALGGRALELLERHRVVLLASELGLQALGLVVAPVADGVPEPHAEVRAEV